MARTEASPTAAPRAGSGSTDAPKPTETPDAHDAHDALGGSEAPDGTEPRGGTQAPPSTDSPRIRLTPGAIDKIREMLEDEDLLETGGLRLTARHGAGCSAPLKFGMILEVEAGPTDHVLEGNGIRLFIDDRSSWSLDGLAVDYVDSPLMGSGFAFQHPRGSGGRAC